MCVFCEGGETREGFIITALVLVVLALTSIQVLASLTAACISEPDFSSIFFKLPAPLSSLSLFLQQGTAQDALLAKEECIHEQLARRNAGRHSKNSSRHCIH